MNSVWNSSVLNFVRLEEKELHQEPLSGFRLESSQGFRLECVKKFRLESLKGTHLESLEVFCDEVDDFMISALSS